MAGESVLTVVGNLTADPQLQYTQGGLAVVNFTVAQTPKVFDRQTNEMKDGEPLFMRCSAWREFAENIAGSLKKGTRVVATGILKQRSYEDREGNKRTSIELEVDAVGPDLRFAKAEVTRSAPGGRGAQAATDWSAANAPAQKQSGHDEGWFTAPVGSTQQYGENTPF